MATTGTKIGVVATAQALALVKGPGVGKAGYDSAANLRILDDKITLAVDHTIDVSEGEYLRFGKVPKGAKIIPFLTRLITSHTAEVPGKITLTPLSGATGQDIASVTIQLEAEAVAASGNSETLSITVDSMLEAADLVTAAEDSWVDFIPAGDLVIASSIKYIRARIVYSVLF